MTAKERNVSHCRTQINQDHSFLLCKGMKAGKPGSIHGQCNWGLSRGECLLAPGTFLQTLCLKFSAHSMWTFQHYGSVSIYLSPLKCWIKLIQKALPLQAEVIVLMRAEIIWVPTKVFSFTRWWERTSWLSEATEQYLCSLKNKFGLPLVIFFFFLRTGVL